MKILRPPLFIYLVLTIFAFLGNVYHLEVIVGVHLIFSSIFIFLILYYFNIWFALLAAFIASIYTVFLWDNPFVLIVYLLEVGFVGVAYHRYKKSMILSDVVFSIFISIPIALLTAVYLMNWDWLDAILVTFKQSVNMLLNVILANMLIIFIESVRLKKRTSRVSLQELLFNLFMLFFLIPLVLSTVFIGQYELEKIKQKMKVDIQNSAHSITTQLNSMYFSYSTPMNHLVDRVKGVNATSPSQIRSDLMFTLQSFPAIKSLYLTDARGIIQMEQAKPAYQNAAIQIPKDVLQNSNQSQLSLSGVYTDSVHQKRLFYMTIPIIESQVVRGYVVSALHPVSLLAPIYDSHIGNMSVTIMDQQDDVIMSNDSRQVPGEKFRQIETEVFFQQPSSTTVEKHIAELRDWIQMSYADEVNFDQYIPWKVHISLPITDYKKDLYSTLIKILVFAYVFACLALALSYGLSKWIQRSMVKVSKATENLPDKIANQEFIKWPITLLEELDTIVDNFKVTETKLRHMFSEILMANNHLQYLAHFDSLTDLYNRNYMVESFNQLIQSTQSSKQIAVLFIDLDRFKTVNDILGHHNGDVMLVEVAHRLKKIVAPEDTIARFGGDKFLIMSPFTHTTDTETKAEDILASLAMPYHLENQMYYLTASIGISLYPFDFSELELLIKYAEMAMYTAKAKGKNTYQFYDSSIGDAHLPKIELENELRHAIQKEQLYLQYQPQMDLDTGCIVGVEALVRWSHPKLGFVPPNEFIPIAEETGSIIEMGAWILHKACRDASQWQQTLGYPINVSVNISMRQFLHDSLLETIKTALANSQLPPERLKLEITESVAMANPDEVQRKLVQIKDLKIELALDDFGTGYSSLSYLKALPVDILKIDRSFIKDIDTNKEDKPIVKAIIDVAHSLGMCVVAEGVETTMQQNILKEINCDQIQGFIFSKPLLEPDLIQMLKNHDANN